MNLTDNDKDKLFTKLDTIESRIEKVERGMYGDKDNGYTGVIHDMGELKKFKASLGRIGASVSAAISITISAIGAFLKG